MHRVRFDRMVHPSRVVLAETTRDSVSELWERPDAPTTRSRRLIMPPAPPRSRRRNLHPRRASGLLPHSALRPRAGRAAWALVCVALSAACNLFASPERIGQDPGLSDLADGVSDAGTSPDAADDATPDAQDNDADATPDASGPEPLFECSPRCADSQFCAPNGRCLDLQTSCDDVGQVCDPRIVPPTQNFVCVPAFGAEVGICRRFCASIQDCPDDFVCQRLYNDTNRDAVCRPACDDDACGTLEVCIDGFNPSCSAACKPFLGLDQCPEQTACAPEDRSIGTCSAYGPLEEDEPCDGDDLCGPGMTCVNLGNGPRCGVLCDSSAPGGATGACVDGDVCEPYFQGDLGLCQASCDLFDPEQACATDYGCTSSDSGRSGTCTFRGDAQRGQPCDATAECSSNLQCVLDRDSGSCERLCLPDAGAGEQGACASNERCEPLNGDLGFCVR